MRLEVKDKISLILGEMGHLLVLWLTILVVLVLLPPSAHTLQVTRHKGFATWQGMFTSGCRMNIIVITMVHPMMAMVGVLVIAQNTLAIRTITLVIAPTACSVGATGATVRRTSVQRTVTATAPRTRAAPAVAVLPDRSPELPEPLNISLVF